MVETLAQYLLRRHNRIAQVSYGYGKQTGAWLTVLGGGKPRIQRPCQVGGSCCP